MDPDLITIFRVQIKTQCQFVMIAAAQLNAALKQMAIVQPAQGITNEVFAALQSLLTSAANISKACWGQGGKYDAARKDLRKSLGIADNSPLRPTSLRNSFDHFDERLDEWWATSQTQSYIDLNVFSTGMIGGAADGDVFRQYDPATREVLFWGTKVNIQHIVTEVEQLLSRL